MPTVTLVDLSAVELARRLTRGEVSAVEVVTAYFDHIDRRDRELHAFVHRFDGEALRQAEALDHARRKGEPPGPLFGLPVTVKENIATRGTDVTLGLRRAVVPPCEDDAVAVDLLRRAGAIVVGKTNVPQTLLAFETVNNVWGTTNNPHHVSRAPGGSSGGEAAALASHMSVLGLGTDIGGSIRVPAAFCGVTGLKPTIFRWSNVGSHGALPGQEVVRSQLGPLARSVSDLVFYWNAISPLDHAALDPRVPPLASPDPSNVDVGKLRIGFYEDDGFFTPSASVRRAVRRAAEALSRAGADVVEYTPPAARDVILTFFSVLSSDGGKALARKLGDEPTIPPLANLRRTARLPEPVRKLLVQTLRLAGEYRLSDLLSALGEKTVDELFSLAAKVEALRQAEAQAWRAARLDAVVCPAFPTPAVPHGTAADFSIGTAYTARYNVLNLPAGVVPVDSVRPDETERAILADRFDRVAARIERGSAGLPLGVQVVGRPYAEHVVLAAMLAVEREIEP